MEQSSEEFNDTDGILHGITLILALFVLVSYLIGALDILGLISTARSEMLGNQIDRIQQVIFPALLLALVPILIGKALNELNNPIPEIDDLNTADNYSEGIAAVIVTAIIVLATDVFNMDDEVHIGSLILVFLYLGYGLKNASHGNLTSNEKLIRVWFLSLSTALWISSFFFIPSVLRITNVDVWILLSIYLLLFLFIMLYRNREFNGIYVLYNTYLSGIFSTLLLSILLVYSDIIGIL